MLSLRILLVEDEPVIAQDIRYILEKNGHQVVQAEEYQDMFPLCAQIHPDLVLLNFHWHHLPDGMVLAHHLQQGLSLQILFLTGAQAKDLRLSKAYDARFPILYKPFTPKQLCHCVNALGRVSNEHPTRPAT